MYLIQFSRQKPPGFGGVERIANDISNFALAKAIKVLNIYFSNANRCSQKTKYINQKFNFRLLGVIKSFLKCENKFNTKEIIYIFHLPSLTNFLLYILLNLLSRKSILIVYWHCFITHRNPFLKLCFKIYQYFALRTFAIFNTKIITTSPILQEELILSGLKIDKIHILPCCISEEEEKFLFKNKTLNKRSNLKNINLVFIGRLCEYKKVDWILNTMSDRKYINLDIVGSGRNFKKYKSISKELGIEDRIKFHGRLNDIEKLTILQESDILILPSITPNEAFGIVQLEAMASETIPIATDIDKSGVSWVGNIRNFLNLDIINKDNLGEVIDKLWLEKDTFENCKLYSKQRYIKIFSRDCWMKNINQYFDIEILN